MSAEYEKIQTWLMVRQAEGKPVNPIFFAMDASHSARGGLLGYLLEGKKAWSEPPPKSYSRPCYAFFEAGMDGLTFTGEVWQDPLIVVINQHAWSILERKSDDCLIIKPEDCRSDRRWELTILERVQHAVNYTSTRSRLRPLAPLPTQMEMWEWKAKIDGEGR